jgi:hypothetical protein
MSEFHKLGEQVGDFLRGLLQIKNAGTTQRVQLPGKKKYVLVDGTELSEGTTVSLDMALNEAEILGASLKDVVFDGFVQFKDGSIFPIQQIIAKDYANALSLQPAPNDFDTWNILANGDIQPFSQRPYQVKIRERGVSETSVVRISGQIFDPNTDKRVNFTVTHDPIETAAVLAIVAGFAALICGGVVLVEAVTNHCTAQGKEQCGKRGVRKITLKRKYGLIWKKGGTEIGCGEECIIECNP